MRKIVYLFVVILFVSSGVFAQQTAFVSVARESLRGTPDVRGRLISSVKRNQSLEVLLDRGGWSLVQTSAFVGWIRSSSISTARFGNPSPSLPDLGSVQGMGTGRGTGVGSGAGMGSGSGTGSGIGSDGDGVGPGLPVSSVTTKELRIISKPRPTMTDKARQNNEQGSVILRIMFLASGQVGSISVVKGLKYGLNEQAIAAARMIKFEPAMSRGGVLKSVSKTVEYTFVIY